MPRSLHSARTPVATRLLRLLAIAAALLPGPSGRAQSAAAPLLRPTSVAYDTAGNLYFAESGNQVVQRLDRSGQISLVAGNHTQGFSGDGGLATKAELDSPRGVAVDTAGIVYIADTRNNRIRAVDPATGQIRTLAGTGQSGFAGDGASALAARLDLPSALALDGAGHLFIADSGNQRIRSLDLTTGIIQTVAGNGVQGFAGDGGPALAASFSSPSGLASDSFGNLFIADSANQRIREVSATSHVITTLAGAGSFGISFRRPEGLSLNSTGNLLIADPGANRVYLLNLSTGGVRVLAGTGTQAFGGDQGVATLAQLDSPMAAAFGVSGELAIADSGNLRIRQVASLDSAATISTLLGASARLVTSLSLAGSSSQPYGSVVLTAIPTSSTAALGTVSLVDGSTPLLTQPLAAGSALFLLPTLSAGQHLLSASYGGDSSHLPAQSAVLPLTVSPLPVTVRVPSTTILYGNPSPTLQASASGILPQDLASVSLALTPQVPPSAVPGTYPITAALTGPAAGNYTLAAASGTLTVARAPVAISLAENSGTLAISVKSSTSGAPTGAVQLLTGTGLQLATAPLSSSGAVSLLEAGLAPGTYTLAALYTGDSNFLPGQSTNVTVTVTNPTLTPAGAADFNLNASGSIAQTIHSGETATFTFALTSNGTALAGPVVLSSAGAPALATVTVDPTVVSPGTGATVVHLTVTMPRAAALQPHPLSPLVPITFAALPLLLYLGRRRLPRTFGPLALLLVSVLPLTLTGCGDRIASTASAQATPTPYTITLTGLTTTSSGTSLQHTATVTLNVL